MPFFDMEDDLSFKAIERTWIYTVPAVLLTIITVAISILWDRWFAAADALGHQGSIEDEETNHDVVVTEDRSILEPKIVTAPNLVDILGTMMHSRRGGEGRDVRDDESNESDANDDG